MHRRKRFSFRTREKLQTTMRGQARGIRVSLIERESPYGSRLRAQEMKANTHSPPSTSSGFPII